MSISSALPIKGGKIFHSNDEAYLNGIERGVEYANDGALTSTGIHSSTYDKHKVMLVIEDRDEDDVNEETDLREPS